MKFHSLKQKSYNHEISVIIKRQECKIIYTEGSGHTIANKTTVVKNRDSGRVPLPPVIMQHK